MESKRTVALYARVSTLAQATGLEAQVAALRSYCERNGVENFQVYTDEGISGAKASRPGLDKLMNDTRAGGVSRVVVFAFSRFARSTKHLLSALEEFDALGVQFVSLTESMDTSSAIGKTIFSILAAISELERELIRERVRNGLQNAVRKGKKLGRAKTRNSTLIRELANRQYSQRQIARLAGCSKTTVMRELRESATEYQK